MLAGAALALAGVALALPRSAQAANGLPTGFSESTVIDGLSNPTTLRFLPDGGLLVAEKSGLLLHFDRLGDPTPDIVDDLRTEVYNYWDRGLLGLALDPDYANNRRIYVLYTRDAAPGGTAPLWGTPNADSDNCPGPTNPPTATAPGPTADGCIATGRLERLTLTPSEDSVVDADTKVLITDWCQQFPSHSIGSLAFDSTGALYVSAGDGASFNHPDYGQDGIPPNPCGDPPTGRGGTQTAPSAEGGALRSQDVNTLSDPTGLDGTVIRVNPDNGDPLPGNPLYGNSNADANARRIVAYGLRNPFRIAFRPGSADELWIGDVGWNTIEEVDRLPYLGTTHPVNFGWPCYEGNSQQGDYAPLNLSLCNLLYPPNPTTTVSPYYSYAHNTDVPPTDSRCPTGTSATTGLAFNTGSAFPSRYQGALFFADYARNCIWAMLNTTGDSAPDAGSVEVFRPAAVTPVELEFGPNGSLYYADLNDGEIRQISYNAPTAAITATPKTGPVPLEVHFTGHDSTDPDNPGPLTYDWDFDGDGTYDSSAVDPTHTYTQPGSYTARLRVTDPNDPTHTPGFDSVRIDVSNSAPVPTIDTPSPTLHWSVGNQISFSGSAVDPEDGVLPASNLDWKIIVLHCPAGCHEHELTTRDGVDHGTFTAPDHDYPSSLVLELTATDQYGLATTSRVQIDPNTVDVVLNSDPLGATVTLDGTTGPAPVSQTVIAGSRHSVSAVPDYMGVPWSSWSDGGALAHDVTVTPDAASFTATFAADGPGPPAGPQPGPPAGGGGDNPTCGGREATIVGTKSAETITGTPGDDVVFGGGGKDKIALRGGDDIVCGDGGRDIIHGGPGADRIRGNAGADRLYGGPGDDHIDGGPGHDRCGRSSADKRRSCS